MAFYGASVEYALHTMWLLSKVPDGISASARDLADFQKLPVHFIRKILTQLSNAGLITGVEGVQGGWALARPAEEISLLSVAEAVQPGGTLFQCREIRQRCALWSDDSPPKSSTSGVCAIHAAMLRAEAAMRRELSAQSIQTIGDKAAAKSADQGRDMNAWFEARFRERGRGNRRASKA